METVKTPLRVHIVLSEDNSSWILEKMAQRLAQHSSSHGVLATIGSEPDSTVDLNHWMSYAFANVLHQTPTTITITHLDDPYKIRMVANLLSEGVDLGIGLSSAHREFLIDSGIAANRLAYVVPAHDFVAPPRRIVVGLTTRVYKDGRKREFMLTTLARTMRLDLFKFEIFGSGWEAVIPALEAAGAEVSYSPGTDDYVADYLTIQSALPWFDYYLYLGRDEGSLGTLDALAAGVRTIVTPQGFHSDLPDGITHAVWDQDDLERIFRDIADDHERRLSSVAGLTWDAYAAKHAALWRGVVAGADVNVSPSSFATPARHESKWELRRRYLQPRRIISALSHVPILKPLRRLLLRRR